MEKVRFASNLLILRKNKNLTQDDLAKKISASRGTITNYEAGVSNPDINTLLIFAKLFDITVDDLLTKDLSKISGATNESISTYNANKLTSKKHTSNDPDPPPNKVVIGEVEEIKQENKELRKQLMDALKMIQTLMEVKKQGSRSATKAQ